jgi:hypothetical protein
LYKLTTNFFDLLNHLKGICHNGRLWLYKVEKMQEEYDAGTQATMDTGTSIAELAQDLIL